ncbi:Don3 interacting protein [Sporisorium reilianum f. sp. reilianum]|uniref:Don3 interacting protein n=1 Tax=Sporisorium reilianum f. sp. reilianum TaxID=72559 RepID=A0A2N8UH08_9BASI|nr:Don3 interacting protein [Sporisorium reilianum f. sp. reilianum]
MSPSIISSSNSNTPTQYQQHPSSQHFSTAKDHFSPGASRPNTMTRTIDLEATVEEWVNGLTSPLSTPSERINILNDIEKTLVTVTHPSRRTTASFLPSVDQTAAVFWALQATAGYSLAEVLLAHVYRLHLDLERENEVCKASEVSLLPSGSSYSLDSSSSKVQGLGLEPAASSARLRTNASHGMSDVQRQRVHSSVSEICIAITILQGLTLCSRASKRITQRKSALELLLQIVLAEYCTHLLPPILCPTPASPALTPTTPSFALPHSLSTPTSTSSSSPSKKAATEQPDDAPLSLPSGFALDLLMCILVDSDIAQERFTHMGGIHQIVQLSHKCADTVTTPASTPVAATSPTFAQAVARSSHVTALKQTDLLCLEFRYFWSQLLQQPERVVRRSSVEGVGSAATSFWSAAEGGGESTTPRASPRKRVSRVGLREQRKEQEREGAAETPKAATRRMVAPTTVRATSEEAPSRPRSARDDAHTAARSGSPRKLRHSASVAELRQKPVGLSKSSISPPPVPPLPTLPTTDSPQSYTADALSASRRQRPAAARPLTSDSRPPSQTQRREERLRRSTVSEASPAPALPHEQQQPAPLGKFHASRPGMSSRDRPRIPSPLKARTPAQEVAELEDRMRRKQALASQQAIPYRRLRSSTTSTPFDTAAGRPGRGREAVDVDENRNPFHAAAAEVVGGKARVLGEGVTPCVSQRTGVASAGSAVLGGSACASERTSLTRIPPSPAVRRAQAARARSLSPSKLSLPLTPTSANGPGDA